MTDQEAAIVADNMAGHTEEVLSQVKGTVKAAVLLVEEYSANATKLAGPDKRLVALKLLAKYVPLPFPLKMCQDFIYGLLIDFAVSKINKISGKVWFRGTSSTN